MMYIGKIIQHLSLYFYTDCDPHPQILDRTTKRLLVKNLPDTADEELLEMFFEHTKRQGGGPVKHVILIKSDKVAIIEFENADSVTKVLDKKPIKIQGTPVEVEAYTPYLENDETIEAIHLYGYLRPLSNELATVKMTDPAQQCPVNRLNIPGKVFCWGCRTAVTAAKYKCRSCDDFYYCKPCLYRKRHLDGHVFTNISPDNDPLRSVHENIWCNGCQIRPIVGNRFRCIICPNFYFCAACKSTQPHPSNHMFVEIV